uniref:PDZ domain-containing protein GIPC1 n=1 Tax=Ciona intestinalis TaxID=7719 RepID=F6XH93_CIOIN|nr:PDZ domain-containing protein GIPC1 [Ciona intestinalis]|eukprot:XP_002123731.1 PDZ domain-containing protein GIPC1 [Ciona intestinalis]
MPFSSLFRKKKDKVVATKPQPPPAPAVTASLEDNAVKQKLVFNAQLAQGSPTASIEGFSNVKELYKKLSEAFNIPVSEIIFCTLNTHKCDMERLLGAQIGLDDFIFVHTKGEKKVLTLTKSEAALGLTITDNGAGYPFVKRIRAGSVVEKYETVCVGDHIESIDNVSTVGTRHFQVAKQLKDIPLNTTFLLTLVEPKKGFDMIAQRGAGKAAPSSNNLGTGKSTVRLRSKGPATLEEAPSEDDGKAVARIEDLLESFMGIRDADLSSTIWECGKSKNNPDEFVSSLNDQLGEFGFPQEFIFDVWGVVLDMRSKNTF